MSSNRTIHYRDMVEHVLDKSKESVEGGEEFSSYNYDNPYWGKVTERLFKQPEYTISHFQTEMNGDYAVAFEADKLKDSVNICFTLEGYTGVQFRRQGFEISLGARKQHGLYIADTEYHVLVKKSMDNVHFSIDLDYYLNFLSDSETWSKQLRQRLERRELVYHGDRDATPTMLHVVNDILYNPLMGSLRKLFMEAKVIELIALQLESAYFGDRREKGSVKRERDLFFSVREHLDNTFMEDHSLKGLGKTFGLNECKLKSGFKNYFSKTIFEYIHDLRMDYAYQLLHDESLLVNEVSSKVGYKNPNHFSTAFKRKFGITPGKI